MLHNLWPSTMIEYDSVPRVKKFLAADTGVEPITCLPGLDIVCYFSQALLCLHSSTHDLEYQKFVMESASLNMILSERLHRVRTLVSTHFWLLTKPILLPACINYLIQIFIKYATWQLNAKLTISEHLNPLMLTMKPTFCVANSMSLQWIIYWLTHRIHCVGRRACKTPRITYTSALTTFGASLDTVMQVSHHSVQSISCSRTLAGATPADLRLWLVSHTRLTIVCVLSFDRGLAVSSLLCRRSIRSSTRS